MTEAAAARHEVVIVGAGPAGLGAARRLGELGVRDVVVLERERAPGGVPRHCHHTSFGLGVFGRPMTGPGFARRIVAAVPGVAPRTATGVTALGPGGALTLGTPDGPAQMIGRRVLLAMGTRETPRAARLISGTRPWGVTTTGALQQFVHLAGLRPFERAVVIGTELVSFSALLTLRRGGITPVAMIEENARITARRPADLIARWTFGVPVLTDTRLVAIRGRERVEAVVVEHVGRRREIACDGVVFTGRFLPEAALLRGTALALDPGSGGPMIDQHWRCSDPAYFAAGNLLHPVETAGRCYREGLAVAEIIAADLQARLPAPGRSVPVERRGALRYVYPQVITVPGRPLSPLLLYARAARELRGALRLVVDGREVWSRRVHALPERRLRLPARLIPTGELERVQVSLDER